MTPITDWCERIELKVKTHTLTQLEIKDGHHTSGVSELAADLPTHYASESRLEHIFNTLGKKYTANYIKTKLPKSHNIKSGDLGEIIAAKYVATLTNYRFVKRLRWKDHEDMAMRGDDIVAVAPADNSNELAFLKGEVKSRATLSKSVVDEARKALLKNNSKPAPHALSFYADRLYEEGEIETANQIDHIQLCNSIRVHQVSHMLFVFCGNNPKDLLRTDLKNYQGKAQQESVSLRVDQHADFIKTVYKTAARNGTNY